MPVAILAIFLIMIPSSKTNTNITEVYFSEEIITTVNSRKTSWVAGRNFDVEANVALLKALAGTFMNDYYYRSMLSTSMNYTPGIPEKFDARIKWPNCSSLYEIRNQGGCRSCWAVAAASSMTDRYCIHSGSLYYNRFSAGDLVTCCISHGCTGGGFVSYAWEYWHRHGVVSGGVYNSNEGCIPYPIPPCTRHGCGDVKILAPHCKHQCRKGKFNKQNVNTNKYYKSDKKFAKTVYAIKGGEDEMKAEIFANGPVEAVFLMYEDFLFYTSGVYRHEVGKLIGGHAVKIIGWGTENGHKYWLAANSWGRHWGEEGFFKIIRGENHCGVESLVVAGIPIIPPPAKPTRSRYEFNIFDKFQVEISW